MEVVTRPIHTRNVRYQIAVYVAEIIRVRNKRLWRPIKVAAVSFCIVQMKLAI